MQMELAEQDSEMTEMNTFKNLKGKNGHKEWIDGSSYQSTETTKESKMGTVEINNRQ